MKMSIAIPCYEYNGRGVRYLSELFHSIQRQTLKDVEVVVSDQSNDDEIQDFCFDNIFDLKIAYYRNKNGRGNAALNTNAAMEICTGEVVKLIYMDDFFYTADALQKTYDALSNSDKMWLVCGTNHTRDEGKTFDHPIYPRWNDRMLKARGNNTMSGTSVISYRNKDMDVRWDPTTFGLLDIDFYHSMMGKYGMCVFLDEILVSQRVNNTDNIISTRSAEQIEKEFEYCREKHGITL